MGEKPQNIVCKNQLNATKKRAQKRARFALALTNFFERRSPCALFVWKERRSPCALGKKSAHSCSGAQSTLQTAQSTLQTAQCTLQTVQSSPSVLQLIAIIRNLSNSIQISNACRSYSKCRYASYYSNLRHCYLTVNGGVPPVNIGKLLVVIMRVEVSQILKHKA